MNRRRFLTACLATFTAPAIVRASSLMPVKAYGAPWVDWDRPADFRELVQSINIMRGNLIERGLLMHEVIIRSHADTPEQIQRMSAYLARVHGLA